MSGRRHIFVLVRLFESKATILLYGQQAKDTILNPTHQRRVRQITLQSKMENASKPSATTLKSTTVAAGEDRVRKWFLGMSEARAEVSI
jgi:hypothetical protein